MLNKKFSSWMNNQISNIIMRIRGNSWDLTSSLSSFGIATVGNEHNFSWQSSADYYLCTLSLTRWICELFWIDYKSNLLHLLTYVAIKKKSRHYLYCRNLLEEQTHIRRIRLWNYNFCSIAKISEAPLRPNRTIHLSKMIQLMIK